MEKAELYNGLSGEIVRNYIRIPTLLSAVPIILVWSVLALTLYLLHNQIDRRYLDFIQWVAMTVITVWMTGRFALAASRGDAHAGFFSKDYSTRELWSYTGRALLFNLGWFLPALALAFYLMRSDNALRLFFFLKLGIGFGWVGIGYALLVILAFFGPLLAAALAVYTESLSEVFSREPFDWLFNEQRDNLACYCSQTVGGIVLFLFKYFLVIVLLQLLVSNLSVRAGLYFNAVLGYLPFILAPILVGRLSGALVAKDGLAMAEMSEPLKEASRPATADHERSVYDDIMKNIPKMTQEEAESHIRQLKEKEVSIDQLLALSYLFSQAGHSDDAIQQAEQALKQCLAQNRGIEAVRLFRFFSKDKKKFHLNDRDLDQLASHLSLQNHYQDAAWCYFTAAKQLQGEPQLLMQKNYLRMADLIRQSGAHEAATGLYSLFCKHFPESSLFEFANSQIEP